MRISFYEPTHTSRHAYKTDTLAVKSKVGPIKIIRNNLMQRYSSFSTIIVIFLFYSDAIKSKNALISKKKNKTVNTQPHSLQSFFKELVQK